MGAPSVDGPVTFAWHDTAAVLGALEAAHSGARLVPAPRGFVLRAAAGDTLARVHVPIVLRLRAEESVDALLRRAGAPLGREVVLLLRAGAAALGLWRDGELMRHKALARYVVRGHGKAQTTHLKTKGKSRYGARLRLQNAQRLLAEVNERLNEWWEEEAGFDALYVACPERTWPELLRAHPAPRFAGVIDPIRIPLHVHEPKHAELLRVRHQLERGTVR